VGNVFGECDTPCTIKTSFVDFKKGKAHCRSTEQLCGFGLWEHLPSTHITDCSLENMNPDVTPHRMSLDISVLPKIIRKTKDATNT
jgi:hypothetical protein